MKTFFGNIFTFLTVFVLVFSQVQPVAAQQNFAANSQTAATSAAPNADAKTAPAEKQPDAVLPDGPMQGPDEVPPSVTLSATPRFITTSGLVTMHWEIGGTLPTDTALSLLVTLAKGYTPDTTLDHSYFYDAFTNTLLFPANGTSGDFLLDVQTPGDDVIFQTSLIAGGQSIADSSLALPKHEEFAVDQNDSTPVSAEDGRVQVSFGDGALSEDVTMNIGAPAGNTPAATGSSLSGQPFEIDAKGDESKKDLHQFAGDISLDVDYSDMDLQGQNEQDLHLYYYDAAINDWDALPTVVDTETKTLHAITTHFSVFDTGINDFKSSRMPTVDSFQVSQFTGAATYSLPIEVPAGPGGQQPSINLSYNSQVIDQSTANTQASWVGMGWSLDMNSITFDDHGTNAWNTPGGWTRDDTWAINVNGVSTTIVRNGTSYQALDENFMRFEYDPDKDTWTVWDKTGNTYFFNKQVKTLVSNSCIYDKQTYEWFLTKERNIFGKELTYTYTDESKLVNVPYSKGGCWLNDSHKDSFVTATYPKTITYANNRYRVRFETEARHDYHSAWVTDAAYRNFQQSRLHAIYIEQNPGGGFNTIVRKYEFVYAGEDPHTWSDVAEENGTKRTRAPVWPGIVWPGPNGQTTTLLQVKEFGEGGSDELPTASFSYGDSMHLTRVDNGYGGAITFKYEPWQYTAGARLSQTINRTGCLDFTQFDGLQNDHSCEDDGTPSLKVRGTMINNGALDQLLTGYKNKLRPGGFYRFSSKSVNAVNSQLSYGLRYTSKGTVFTQSTQHGAISDAIVALPASAHIVDVLLRATHSGPNTGSASYVKISDLTIQLLTAVYRVSQRSVFTRLQTTPDVYGYTYDEPAVNDSKSLGSCSDKDLQLIPPKCAQYHEKYSEFRGNGTVTETAPDGHITVTRFFQADSLLGRPYDVIVKGSNGVNLTEHVTTYNTPAVMGMNPMSSVAGPGNTPPSFHYADIQHTWVTTKSEENRTYANDGTTYSATQTIYAYDAPKNYGNLLTTTEFFRDGTQWIAYRKTDTDYAPFLVDPTHYLTSLPVQQIVRDMTDPANPIVSRTLTLYDGAATITDKLTDGIKTAMRTWVDGANYIQVSYGYDKTWGNQTQVTTYDGYAKLNSAPTTPPITQTTTFESTYHTYPTKQTSPSTDAFPAGLVTNFTYDNTLGLPLTQTDPNGVGTTVTYDHFGRLTELIKNGDSSDSPTLQISYHDTAIPFNIELKQKINDTDTYMIRHSYDGLGREIKTETGHESATGSLVVFNTVDHQYDATADKSSVSAPYAPGEMPIVYTTTITDALGRPVSVTAPDKTATTYAYNGLTTTVTDAKRNATATTTDVWGRTIFVDSPAGPDLSYSYDAVGNLLYACLGGSSMQTCVDDTSMGVSKTSVTYDKVGRKLTMVDPDMGTWQYTYDARGNLLTQTDARLCTLTLGYDNLNRLVSKSSSDTGHCVQDVDTTYSYDATANGNKGKGRRTGMSDVSGFTDWVYDTRGRVSSETKHINGHDDFITHYTYNSADLPLSMTYPDGEVINNTYTPQMMLDTVSGTNNYILHTNYDSAGRMIQRIFGNPSGNAAFETDYG